MKTDNNASVSVDYREEYILRVKLGVYFIPTLGKVYRFLDSADKFIEYLTEVSVGLRLKECIQSVVGVERVCPEHFCYELQYVGPGLDVVLQADESIILDTRYREMCVYNMVMLKHCIAVEDQHLYDGLWSLENTCDLACVDKRYYVTISSTVWVCVVGVGVWPC